MFSTPVPETIPGERYNFLNPVADSGICPGYFCGGFFRRLCAGSFLWETRRMMAAAVQFAVPDWNSAGGTGYGASCRFPGWYITEPVCFGFFKRGVVPPDLLPSVLFSTKLRNRLFLRNLSVL